MGNSDRGNELHELPVLNDSAGATEDRETAYVAPRTPMERQLTEIFEELLETGRVGVHDTFFELNGFSLLATQLAARIYDIFKVELTLRDVFEAPTVEGLAQLIVQSQAEMASDEDLQALLAEIE